MLNAVLRVIIILWAIAFGLIAVRGLIDPRSYNGLLGILCTSSSTNTFRADLSSFFLVSAGGALYGALVPGAARALWVPAALFGTALFGRLYGVMLGGDQLTSEAGLGMIIEAISTTLMLFGWWHFARRPVADTPALVPAPATAPAQSVPPATDGDLP